MSQSTKQIIYIIIAFCSIPALILLGKTDLGALFFNLAFLFIIFIGIPLFTLFSIIYGIVWMVKKSSKHIDGK